MFLEECMEDLRDRITVLKSRCQGVHLPNHQVLRIQQEDHREKVKHQRLLQEACNRSRWREAGRRDLITNISSRILTDTEAEALSLGLKFDTGIPRKDLLDHVVSNHRWGDKDIDVGFKQGVITCCMSSAKNATPAIPRRYIKALRDLGKDVSISIITADKGGGVVVMDRQTYTQKIGELLEDDTTYRRLAPGKSASITDDFSSAARNTLKKTKVGKKLRWMLEAAPRLATLRGLAKLHKPEIPMRPIMSAIGSAPHRLAAYLAKPLSAALGKISGNHLRNSSDLMDRLKRVAFKNKRLASFDVKSLFTNVPIDGAITAAKRAVGAMTDNDLPLPRRDFIKLVELCVRYGVFEFDGVEYEQIEGLAMGSPLSAVLACLFMETLEVDHYMEVVGQRVVWLRYVDDIIVVVPCRTDLPALLTRLNAVHPSIQFTVEEEQNECLPFLDTVVTRQDSGPVFRVYRKPTNKDDFVHFFSHHSRRTKEDIVTGFFLRALRVCSPETLEDEIQYITDAFIRLQYPPGLLLRMKCRATNIMNRTREETETKPRLILPQSALTTGLQQQLGKHVTVTTATGTKIADLVKMKRPKHTHPDSVIYKIPCGGCDTSYFGETGRGLVTRVNEHKADFRYHRTTNAMVVHSLKDGHLPRWKDATILHQGLAKTKRKAIEAAIIATSINNNSRPGSLRLANAIAHSLVTAT